MRPCCLGRAFSGVATSSELQPHLNGLSRVRFECASTGLVTELCGFERHLTSLSSVQAPLRGGYKSWP